MPNIDLDRLDALAQAATPGPWDTFTADGGSGLILDVVTADMSRIAVFVGNDTMRSVECRNNAIFAAAASPDVIRALVTALRAAQADAARLDWLQERVADAGVWEDIGVCWDHEDGFWLTVAERGTLRGMRALDDSESPSTSLREALDAARTPAPTAEPTV